MRKERRPGRSSGPTNVPRHESRSPRGARPGPDGKPRSGKPSPGKSFGSTPHAGKLHAGKPHVGKPHGVKPRDAKPQTDRPRGGVTHSTAQRDRVKGPDIREHRDISPRRLQRADQTWLFGHHAVSAALGNPERRVLRLLATQEAYDKLSAVADVPRAILNHAQRVDRRDIDDILGDGAVHQGIALLTQPLSPTIADVIERATATPSAVFVVLDQVSDPHNVGAIVRSAAAFGATAVIAPDRNAPHETGTMAKAASGAIDRIAYVQVVNIARTLDQLKENGFWIVGLAGDGAEALSGIDLKGRIALVLGTESEGLRRLVREGCDYVARLPIHDGVESLNVSNAAAVALYERARQLGLA